MRVVSICPSNTELLAYLDALSYLVGIDDFSDWPESIQSLPRLGPDLSIRMDDLEALNPDLVLASLSVPGMEKNIDELNKRKIPHIVLNPQSLNDIANDMRIVAKALNIEEKGIQISDAYLEQINIFKATALKANTKPKLYWEWWPKPVFTPGNINWLTEVSQLTGGENLFSDVELASVQTDWEDVYIRNPDYICLAWVGVSKKRVNPAIVKKRPNWDQLSAVVNNRILILEEYLYCRPSPRLIQGIYKLGKILHPNQYNNIELYPFFREE